MMVKTGRNKKAKKGRNNTPSQTENNNNSDKVDETDAICGKCQQSDQDNKWVGCDECKLWFHYRCIKIAHAYQDVKYMSWLCQQCAQKKHPNLEWGNMKNYYDIIQIRTR